MDGNASTSKPLGLPDACNVVDCSTGKQRFWRFTKGKNQMKMVDVRETVLDEPILDKYLERDASQMWNPHCQNDAWLPSESVFFRVLQLPQCEPAELPGMLELQLDKISPLPLSQAVWTYEVVPVYRKDRTQQTVVVMVASRQEVEQYLGELESVGYRPDRLETPVLHQVMATPQGGEHPDGAWIYPRFTEEQVICTVAWWDEGVLHNITQIMLSTKEHLNELTEHLTATTWAGEMEGWLTGETHWHLVVDNEVGEEWLAVLNDWAGKGVQVAEPPEVNALAGVSAARAARSLDQGNLLPPDRRAAYRRDDVDRMWGNIFIGVILLYIMLLAGYFVWKSQVADVTSQAVAHNKSVERHDKRLKSLLVEQRLMEEQLQLRWSALDVMKAVAEFIPEKVTLDTMHLEEARGKGVSTVRLFGTADDGNSPGDYARALREATVMDRNTNVEHLLFNEVAAPSTQARGGNYNWSIVCVIRREEIK